MIALPSWKHIQLIQLRSAGRVAILNRVCNEKNYKVKNSSSFSLINIKDFISFPSHICVKVWGGGAFIVYFLTYYVQIKAKQNRFMVL